MGLRTPLICCKYSAGTERMLEVLLLVCSSSNCRYSEHTVVKLVVFSSTSPKGGMSAMAKVDQGRTKLIAGNPFGALGSDPCDDYSLQAAPIYPRDLGLFNLKLQPQTH